MPVNFDAKCTADTTGAGATSATINNLTIGPISNVALKVGCSYAADPGAITTKTWNGVSLIEVGRHAASDGAVAVELGLVGAATGNHTLALAWANNVSFTISACSYSGADQGSSIGTFTNFNFNAQNVSTGTNALAVTVNSPTGNMTTFTCASLNAGFTTGASGNGTTRWADNTNVSGGGADNPGTGVGSSCGIDISATTNQPAVAVGCSIAAVGSVVVVGDTLAINQDMIFM